MTQQEVTLEDRQLHQLFAYWRNEDLTKLSLIKGYAELLLEGGFGTITDDQRQAIDTISQVCQKAIQAWHNRSYRIHPLLHQEIVIEPMALSEVIKEALDYLREQIPVDKITVSLSDALPLVNTSRELATAVVILVGYLYRQWPYRKNFSATITAALDENKAIKLQIRSAQGLELTNINSTLFESDFDLRLANLVIQQHNSKITILPFDKGIEFQIIIPV